MTPSSRQSPAPRALRYLLVCAVLTAAAPTNAAEIVPAAPPAEPPAARIALPFLRIGLLHIGMHIGASALWPNGYDPTRIRKNRDQLARSFRNQPRFDTNKPLFASDGDWWTFNVFAHGLFGSEAYLSGRDMKHGVLVSFLYALFASCSWEYLVEGRYKQPSAIDLFWTPAAGTILGELRFRLYRLVSTRVKGHALRLALQIIINPVGRFQYFLMGYQSETL